MADTPDSWPELSVVVPVMDEADNIAPLVREIAGALEGRVAFEIVYVDDGSSDASFEQLKELARAFPMLRARRHATRRGQSAAILSGVKVARAQLVATLDGDGQNDPADIPTLLERYRAYSGQRPLMLAGQRTRRQDSWLKRTASLIANGVRTRALGDRTPDTGCGLKLFPRDVFLSFPAFDHMHRFLPALMLRAGGHVESVPVHHRARARGVSKYGIWDRLLVGLADLRGVAWLMRRRLSAEIAEDIGGSDANR